MQIRGLPIEFWRAVRTRSAKTHGIDAKMWKSHPEFGRTIAEVAFYEGLSTLFARHGPDRVVQLGIIGLPANFTARVSGRLLQAAPGGTIYHLKKDAAMEIVLGPITSYRAVLNTIDFGEVTFEEEAKGVILVRVDVRRLEEQARLPEKHDPRYYEIMAERLLERNPFVRGPALRAMAEVRP